MWVVQEGLGAWDLKFLRLFDDWEMDAIQAFIGFVSNSVITPLVKDKLIWKSDVSSCFTVNAYSPPPPFVQSPPKCFGIPMSLQKLVFLLGWLGGGKVLTTSQLKKRGFYLASKCPFCGRKE